MAIIPNFNARTFFTRNMHILYIKSLTWRWKRHPLRKGLTWTICNVKTDMCLHIKKCPYYSVKRLKITTQSVSLSCYLKHFWSPYPQVLLLGWLVWVAFTIDTQYCCCTGRKKNWRKWNIKLTFDVFRSQRKTNGTSEWIFITPETKAKGEGQYLEEW